MPLIEEHGDLWDKWTDGYWISITTNPIINSRDELVMGRGVALQAKNRFPDIAKRLAHKVKHVGNVPIVLPDLRIITLPVKWHWRYTADRRLIVQSLCAIDALLDFIDIGTIYIPRPGCGNGGLCWEDVREFIAGNADLDLSGMVFIDR